MMRNFTLFVLGIVMAAGQAFAQTWPASGGPDVYGYRYETFNSTDARFRWVDITRRGTEVFGLADDNFVGPVDIGFDFQYYWFLQNQVYIGSNGYISFGKGFNISSTAIGFPPTPTPDENNDILAPFMCDLSFDGGGNTGRCYVYSNDVDSFVVTYLNVPFWTNNTAGYAGSNTFQVILSGADSTIKFQYLQQNGTWNASYNMTANPMVTGIENVTGNIGLMVANTVRPTGGTGAIFYAPRVAGIQVPDISPVSVQNGESGGFFVPIPGRTFRFNTRLSNVGNTAITSNTALRCEARDSLNQLLYVGTAAVPGLAVGADSLVTFTTPFAPPLAGPFTVTVAATNPDDINPTNDNKVIEAVAVDTTGGKATLSYVSENRFNVDGLVLWTSGSGNSGVGVYYEPVAYPARIESIDFFLRNASYQIMNLNDSFPRGDVRIAIHEHNPSSLPGAVLFDQVVPRTQLDIISQVGTQFFLGAWNKLVLPTPITINSGGFYVSWYHLNDSVALVSESRAPISRRSYEILGGTWSPHRSNTEEDYFLRVNLDVKGATVGVGMEDLQNLSSFTVYPNPSAGNVQVAVKLQQPEALKFTVSDAMGRKVLVRFPARSAGYQEQLDLSGLPAGIYLLNIAGDKTNETRRIVLE